MALRSCAKRTTQANKALQLTGQSGARFAVFISERLCCVQAFRFEIGQQPIGTIGAAGDMSTDRPPA
jgi:hypothetical protein